MDRRDTVRTFRVRLAEAIERSGLSRSALARAVGVDRSTLSQLLSNENDRLPRADTVAAIASTLQVSLDWLLGLSQEEKLGADILQQSMQIEPGSSDPADERLSRWHAEAAGYKIRYVPTTLPDALKTDDVIRYEFDIFAAGSTRQGLMQSHARRAHMLLPEAEIEVCSPIQALEAFARGEGVWRGLTVEARREQLAQMVRLAGDHYPSFRWFLYDGLARFSVPLTIFGPHRAAIYVGQMYFVFNTVEHIRVLAQHFDELIRSAVVQPPDVGALLERLLGELDSFAPARASL